MDKPSDWVVLTQRLGYCPEGWVKHLTQMLVENNPIAGFVHILPSIFRVYVCLISKEQSDQYFTNIRNKIQKWTYLCVFLSIRWKVYFLSLLL